jgi:TolB-like protein/Flp pilus assembly protein TadD
VTAAQGMARKAAMSFFGELKRRKVFQVAVVYAVVGWLLIQIAVSIEAPLNLPDWVDTLVIVLVAAGFPVALILSWAYDVTPRGLVQTPTADADAEARSRETAAKASAGGGPDRPAVLHNSVAVLPFENLSPDPNRAYFAAGVHEEILNQLAKIQDLRVIARTSVMRYEGARRSIQEIAHELHVGTVMEGSVRYAGERVRVTAQLIEASTEDHLWSEVYERDLADVFAIQADIAGHIARALEAKFSSAEQQRVERPVTKSTEAYMLFLQAKSVLRRMAIDDATAFPDTLETLRNQFDAVIAADPEFALAYAHRARINASTLRFDIGTEETHEARRAEIESSALADVDKALALDPNTGLAYETLALIHQGNWRADAAREAYESALRLLPNDAQLLGLASVFYAVTGEHRLAVSLGERAIELDPGNGLAHYWLAITYLEVGQPEAALPQYGQAVELLPHSMSFVLNLALLEQTLGKHELALAHARIGERLVHNTLNPAGFAMAANAYGYAGDHASAARMNELIESAAETRRVASAVRVLGYLGIGDETRALHWLRQLAEHRDPHEAYFGHLSLKGNWYADPILEKPQFVAVRKKLGFQK